MSTCSKLLPFATVLFLCAACDPGADPDSASSGDENSVGDGTGSGDPTDSDPMDPSEPADPSGDPSDSGDPTDPDPGGPDTPPFDNDPGDALAELDGMLYACYGPDDAFYNIYFEGDAISVFNEELGTIPGTYSVQGGAVHLSVPDLGYAESSTATLVELDLLAAFETPTLRCNAISYDFRATGEVDVVKCPSIKYIPETSWEDNELTFAPGGAFKRRRWTELPQIPDTLYSEWYGLWVRLGDQVYMVTPFAKDGEQFLTGTVTAEGIYIDQLEPERGACS